MLTLYPDQAADLDRLRGAFLEHDHVLFVAPTGYGKTVLACAIAQGAVANGTRTCFLVHRKELIAQTARAFTACGIPHGIISPDHAPRSAPIQIASVFTLARRAGHEFDFLIYDEVHHRVAGSWNAVAAKFPQARSLGLTATPARLDGRGLGDAFGHMILAAPMRELIGLSRLSPYDYWAPEVADLSGLRSRGADYSREALERAMRDRSITGNTISHYKRICDGAPFLCQCVSVAHAQRVAEDFRAAGYPVAALWGDMDPVCRARTVAGLGRTLVGITFVDLISEGFDVPGVTCVISLRKTKSLTLYLQVMGRGLRYVPGKRAVLLDCVGNALVHGLPDTPRDWVLEPDRGVRTPDADAADTPAIRRCPHCYAVHEWAPQCPHCGHVYEAPKPAQPAQRRGELIQLTEDQIRDLEAHARRSGRLSDWHEVARAKGHKPGWAYHQHKRARASAALRRA